MLVVEPIDHTTCKIIHYRVEKSIAQVLKFKKGDVISEAVNIFGYRDVFQIVYPECTDPQKHGMEKLQGRSQDFHEGGAQFNGVGIVRGIAAHGQLCWP